MKSRLIVAIPLVFLNGCGPSQPSPTKKSVSAAMLSPVTSNASDPSDPSVTSDAEHGGPWTVRVPGGALHIGVDTVGSSGPREQSLGEAKAMIEDPSDGADDYDIFIDSSAAKTFLVKWRVEGEKPHPIGAHDLGEITGKGPKAAIGFPSGFVVVSASTLVGQINLWAPEDHATEPCEHFRVSLYDASGRPLVAENGAPVVAHGVVRPKFDPTHSEAGLCSS